VKEPMSKSINIHIKKNRNVNATLNSVPGIVKNLHKLYNGCINGKDFHYEISY
jgi:hypothetical protein